MPHAIDVDDPTAWPSDLRGEVAAVAERLVGTTEHTSDLEVTNQDESVIMCSLAGVDVRLYHATRLLPHEVDQIRHEGLRVLDVDLINEKLDGALRAGMLSVAERTQLASTHAPIDGSAGRRAAQVCAVLTPHAFSHDVHGVWPLMSSWGGESIYWAHERTPLGARLTQIGSPAIVVFTAPAALDDNYFPSLAKALVAAVLGLPDVNADVFLHEPVPPERIENIWTPGIDEYDQWPDLPR